MSVLIFSALVFFFFFLLNSVIYVYYIDDQKFSIDLGNSRMLKVRSGKV